MELTRVVEYAEHIAQQVNKQIEWVEEIAKQQNNMRPFQQHAFQQHVIDTENPQNYMHKFQQSINVFNPIPTSCVSIGSQSKTFTIEEVIKLIDSVTTKELDEDWSSFGSITPNTDVWIRKSELIEKLKK